LKPVLKDGEFDEWVELSYKNRYAGEVYLEMTYYSEAPPPVPALPTDMQSRDLHSRDSSHTGSVTKLKRRPLPQQPDLDDRTPPPSRGFPRHPYEQLPPSTSHSTHSSMPQFVNYQSEYDPPYDYQHDRQQSLGYDREPFPDYAPHVDYSHSAPDSPTLGRRRSEASIRVQYYDIQPLQEVERMTINSAVSNIRSEPRLRPRTSLPLSGQIYLNDHPPVTPHAFETPRDRHRHPLRRESLDEYYKTPPLENYMSPIPLRDASLNRVYDEPQEPIPVYPYVSPLRQPSPPPAPASYVNPHTPPQNFPQTSPQQQPTYSPHTPQQVSIPQQPPTHYSPTPPPHRIHPTPPSRSSASPRTPLKGGSPHPPLKKPTPVRAIDHLPPSSYAPEHTPPAQRRALPTPPIANSSPSEYSLQTSPLTYRAPDVPAKIPIGMTEREYWAVTELENENLVYDVHLRGLHDDNGWREMRSALPNFDSRQDAG